MISRAMALLASGLGLTTRELFYCCAQIAVVTAKQLLGFSSTNSKAEQHGELHVAAGDFQML